MRSKHLIPAPSFLELFRERCRGTSRSTLVLLALILVIPVAPGSAADGALRLDQIELPPGFTIELYATVPDARSMTLSPNGVLYVGTRRLEGKVYAARDTNGDQTADEVDVIADGLNMPNGVAWRDGSLYVAEIHRILRFDGIDDKLDAPPEPVVLVDDFPTDRHHGWKFLAFGPDDRLYVPVGAPCNICDPELPYSALHSMLPDGTDRKVHTRGIRHTVGFDWHPESSTLWFTDNGRDWMGDDMPPDELNRVPEAGLDFGYPACHAGRIPDPEFGHLGDCSEFVAPAQDLGPHVAAIGMRFYTGDQFPTKYRNQILIAEHGSWNRKEKIGYRVMLVTLDDQERATAYEPFATGWLQGQEAWGRPVDVLVMPDGALLVSDDAGGAIYRISYRSPL